MLVALAHRENLDVAMEVVVVNPTGEMAVMEEVLVAEAVAGEVPFLDRRAQVAMEPEER